MPIIPLTVADIEREVAAAQEVSPALLQANLNEMLYQSKAFNLRLAGAQAVNDEARVSILKKELERADALAAQFREMLATDFPEYKPTEPDYTEVTQAVIVGEYIDAVRSQRDAQLSGKVAKGMGLEDRIAAAFEAGKKSRQYIEYYKPKYEKVLKVLKKGV